MNDKLRDAIDFLQEIVDRQADLFWPEGEEELKAVLEAADRYWEDRYNKGYDGY